jgi:ComF family protein
MSALLDRLASVIAPPFCWGCGADAVAGQPLCRECRSQLRWRGPEPVALDGLAVWAPVAYDGPAKAVVRGLKYRGAPGLAEPLAAQIAAGAPRELIAPTRAEAPALVPVPLHPARRRRRGFNQAERIALALGRRTGLAVADCLVREGGARRQVGRGRADRLAGPEDAIRAPAGVPPGALLVDDVVTTGATLAACARALRAAGTTDVAALAYAWTPGR